MPRTPNHRGRRTPERGASRATSPATEWLYPIPQDTRRALETFRGKNKEYCNLGLLFDRYIGYLPGWRLDDKHSNPKKDALEQIRKVSLELEKDRELLDAYAQRWRTLIGDAVVLEGNPKWRFLTGLGRKGPLEVGFTFHPLYGFPIIPGSGLKGLAHAYAKLVTHVSDADLARVFGTPTQQGKAIFFDAIPAVPPVLELDVMNPHYPDYYQKDEPPANWQSPQPVFFLTLGAASTFWFAVGGEEKGRAAEWLLAALDQMGAGAKTSAGYGYWRVKK